MKLNELWIKRNIQLFWNFYRIHAHHYQGRVPPSCIEVPRFRQAPRKPSRYRADYEHATTANYQEYNEATQNALAEYDSVVRDVFASLSKLHDDLVQQSTLEQQQRLEQETITFPNVSIDAMDPFASAFDTSAFGSF